MTRIVVTDRIGMIHEIDADADLPLMLVLRDHAGLPVEGLCGGSAACGTCHVYVDATWVDRLPGRQNDEEAMLDALGRRDLARSRLSCQLRATSDLEGLRLTLAPEE